MADEKKTCRELDEHFAPYVDGEENPAARRSIEAHLAACPPCHERAEAERAARDVVVENRDRLRSAAPVDLRARCAALQSPVTTLQSSAFAKASRLRREAASAGQAAGQARGWAIRRWMPLSLAASLVLAVAGVFVFGLNDRVEALAASLAIDHAKCFKVDGTSPHTEPSAAETRWQQDQGWPIVVPASEPAQQLTLVNVRRCFTTDGRSAHMMYAWRGAPLSLYVLDEPDGNAGRDRIVDKMGHETVIWCANRRTYAVVAQGHPQDLSQVVHYMKAHVR
jgi:anti-sigma factor (TIGR02949 family)